MLKDMGINNKNPTSVSDFQKEKRKRMRLKVYLK